MVDTAKALESKYVNVDLVKNSPSKVATFLNEGKYEQGDFGEKLVLLVEMDGKQRFYAPSKDTIRNLNQHYGTDTAHWVGKRVVLTTIFSRGKECVAGYVSLPAPNVQMTQNGRVV